MHPLRSQVRELRLRGLSYKEIKDLTGVGKSSIHYMVKNIDLTDKQQKRLDKKIADNRVAFSKRSPNIDACRKGGINSQKLNGPKVQLNLLTGRRLGSLAYRKDEIPVKNKLEKLYSCVFHKVEIANKYIDFGNRTMLIEHTIDNTKGVLDVIKRFQKVDSTGDKRKRIAYIPKQAQDTQRTKALLALNVEVHDVREL